MLASPVDLNGPASDMSRRHDRGHGHGGTPMAGWFISWKIPEMDDDWGVPPFQETPTSSRIWQHILVLEGEAADFFPVLMGGTR